MPSVNFWVLWLSLNDFAAAQAGSANANPLGGGAHAGMNCAQVNVPAALSHIVRVADTVSELRPFAAKFTYLCH